MFADNLCEFDSWSVNVVINVAVFDNRVSSSVRIAHSAQSALGQSPFHARNYRDATDGWDYLLLLSAFSKMFSADSSRAVVGEFAPPILLPLPPIASITSRGLFSIQ